MSRTDAGETRNSAGLTTPGHSWFGTSRSTPGTGSSKKTRSRAGLHWPPDDSTDHGEPSEGGWLVPDQGGAVLDKDDNVVEEEVWAQSLVISLNHIVEKLNDGSLPPGKTVVVIDTLWEIDDLSTDDPGSEQRYREWCSHVEQALDEIDRLGGVMVSVAAGNEGKHNPPGETGDFMPNILARHEGSPLVIADQAACMLSDPALHEALKWSSDDLQGHTVANRLKELLSEEGKGSFQRVARGRMLDPASATYPVPERLNVVCNSCAVFPRTGESSTQ
ncbi:hypothetical protein INS49_009529 [Diaporthe citri]|uniref:uncharacterized protein n=1 Tax=Diaporthe citri TaxID=83186 RepID=UPI001C7FE2A7|nr:uncharacterized protein INS49_009529 [Diaporthe citri]KAG6361304.1 hypothetical protein INS49_009529 [Diaporthe citri]